MTSSSMNKYLKTYINYVVVDSIIELITSEQFTVTKYKTLSKQNENNLILIDPFTNNILFSLFYVDLINHKIIMYILENEMFGHQKIFFSF